MSTLIVLLNANVRLLEQSLRLLNGINDAVYRPIGPQLRHVLEFYECFLRGAGAGFVDYDARRRDAALESCRAAALHRARTIASTLSCDVSLRSERVLDVRMEDAPAGLDDAPLRSSVGRELQSLMSHTTHHFALIAIMLRSTGVVVEPDFGVALSTLRHRERMAEACAR